VPPCCSTDSLYLSWYSIKFWKEEIKKAEKVEKINITELIGCILVRELERVMHGDKARRANSIFTMMHCHK